MKEHSAKVLEQAMQTLAEQEQAVLDTKKFINQLCRFEGEPARFQIDDAKSSAGLTAIRPDSFYGKVVTTAAREFLEMRKASGLGAASYNEIIDALERGGFDFDSLSPERAVAQRTVSITLGKNSSIFHKLPNGNWGLLSWYPDAKEKKKDAKDTNGKKASITVPEPESPVAAKLPAEEKK